MTTYRAIRPAGPEGGAQLVRVAGQAIDQGEAEIIVAASAIGRDDAEQALGTGRGNKSLAPGRDLAGVIQAAHGGRWSPGDPVLATGQGLSVTHAGGWAERCCIPLNWLLRRPDELTDIQAMAIGTPGLAAMEAALAIDYQGVPPEAGPVLVTGATGGVGTLAILALTSLGYRVTAATRRPALDGLLRDLGAGDVIAFAELARSQAAGTGPYSAAIDCLGGAPLAAVAASVQRNGVIAAVGEVAGARTTLLLPPFLSGRVVLLGIDAVAAARSRREEAWSRWREALEDAGFARRLALLTSLTDLDGAVAQSEALLEGRTYGRIVVQIASPPAPPVVRLH